MVLARKVVSSWLVFAGIPLLVAAAEAILTDAASAQRLESGPSIAKNALYVEFGGNGGVLSLNYERALTEGLRLRVGWGSWSNGGSVWGSSSNTTYNVFPVMLQRVSSAGGKNHLELGGGILVGSEHGGTSGSILDVEGMIGYRRQSPGGGFVLRVGLAAELAVQGDYPDGGALVLPGLSVGFAF